MIEFPSWTPTELAWMRVLLVAALLVLGRPERPASLSAPVGVARFLPLDRVVGWRYFDRVHMVMAVLFAARLADPLAGLGLALLTLAAVTAAASEGAVNHGRHLLLLVIGCHAVFDTLLWIDDTFDLDLDVQPDRAAAWSVQAIVAMYFAAGVSKAVNSGGSWVDRSQNLQLVVVRRSYLSPGSATTLTARFDTMAGSRPRVLALAAAGGLLVEVASPLALVHPVAMFVTGLALIAVHIFNGLFLRLSFTLNQAIIATFMVAFSLPLG